MHAISRFTTVRTVVHQTLDIVVLYVTTIFAQVRGDAISARLLALRRRKDGVRFRGATRLAKRRDVVNVNVKSLVHSG